MGRASDMSCSVEKANRHLVEGNTSLRRFNGTREGRCCRMRRMYPSSSTRLSAGSCDGLTFCDFMAWVRILTSWYSKSARFSVFFFLLVANSEVAACRLGCVVVMCCFSIVVDREFRCCGDVGAKASALYKTKQTMAKRTRREHASDDAMLCIRFLVLCRFERKILWEIGGRNFPLFVVDGVSQSYRAVLVAAVACPCLEANGKQDTTKRLTIGVKGGRPQ